MVLSSYPLGVNRCVLARLGDLLFVSRVHSVIQNGYSINDWTKQTKDVPYLENQMGRVYVPGKPLQSYKKEIAKDLRVSPGSVR